VHPWSLF